MNDIMIGLKKYNDTHEKSLSYGKYVQMLAEQDKQLSEQGKKKEGESRK